MSTLLKKVHLTFYYFLLTLFFCISYPFLRYYSQNPEKNFSKLVRIRKWLSVYSMYAAGIRVKVKFEESINWSKGPYIICPNHTSILDICIVNLICKTDFSYIGKEELLKNPITGIFFRTIDISINRDSKISSFRAFTRASEWISKGKSIVVFPEGKIDDEYPPRLHKFKPGPFRIASDNGLPIIPIVIHDAWKTLWDDGKTYGSKPGVIHVSVLKPIYTHKYSNKEDLKSIEKVVYKQMDAIWKTPL